MLTDMYKYRVDVITLTHLLESLWLINFENSEYSAFSRNRIGVLYMFGVVVCE